MSPLFLEWYHSKNHRRFTMVLHRLYIFNVDTGQLFHLFFNQI